MVTCRSVNSQFCNRECYRLSKRRPTKRRKCTKCGKTKHQSKFVNQSWCRACGIKATITTLRKPESRHKYAVTEAQRRNIPWAITKDEHLQMLSQSCHYCGGPLSPRGVGLDRKDDDGGYTIENVVPCCGRCNRVKSSDFTYEEMVLLGQVIHGIDKKRKKEAAGKAFNDPEDQATGSTSSGSNTSGSPASPADTEPTSGSVQSSSNGKL